MIASAAAASDGGEIVIALISNTTGDYAQYEGHGFHNQENRFDFYRAMEAFLKKYL